MTLAVLFLWSFMKILNLGEKWSFCFRLGKYCVFVINICSFNFELKIFKFVFKVLVCFYRDIDIWIKLVVDRFYLVFFKIV